MNLSLKAPVASVVALISLSALGLASSGCSSARTRSQAGISGELGAPVSEAGVDPEVVVLDSYFRPTQRTRIVATISDDPSPIVDVTARFLQIPLEIPLTRGDGQWHADMTAQQLRMLAVSGQTMRYDISLSIRDAAGRTIVTPGTFQLAIQAPDSAHR